MAFFTNDGSAEDLSRQAVEMAEREGALEAQARAMIVLAMNQTKVYGKYNETIHMLEKVIPFCESNGLWYYTGVAYSDLAQWLEDYTWEISYAYEHAIKTIKIDLQIGDVDALFWALSNFISPAVKIGKLAALDDMLADFLSKSSVSKGCIQQFHEGDFKLQYLYRGEWAKALEYSRLRLEIRREWKSPQGIVNSNLSIAESQIYLTKYMGLGDLVEAEAALVENLEIGAFPMISKTLLAKVYSLQGRFADAHHLLAELLSAPPKLFLEAKAIHAMAERRWDQAASVTQSLIKLLQGSSRRWEWARALIDLGDIYAQRGQPGDRERAREAYQQSLEMFSEMEAGGYVRVVKERLYND
jgi:tetratricopeptide (TPR) repeat protein